MLCVDSVGFKTGFAEYVAFIVAVVATLIKFLYLMIYIVHPVFENTFLEKLSELEIHQKSQRESRTTNRQ